MRPGSQPFIHKPYMNPGMKPNIETRALHKYKTKEYCRGTKIQINR